MDDLQMTAGWRRCRHCTLPFQPPEDLVVIPERPGARAVCVQCNTWTSVARANLTRAIDAGDSDDLAQKFELLISGPELSQLSAWVEGFCSRACMHGHALDVVAKRAAWWLKRQPREGAA